MRRRLRQRGRLIERVRRLSVAQDRALHLVAIAVLAIVVIGLPIIGFSNMRGSPVQLAMNPMSGHPILTFSIGYATLGIEVVILLCAAHSPPHGVKTGIEAGIGGGWIGLWRQLNYRRPALPALPRARAIERTLPSAPPR